MGCVAMLKFLNINNKKQVTFAKGYWLC